MHGQMNIWKPTACIHFCQGYNPGTRTYARLPCSLPRLVYPGIITFIMTVACPCSYRPHSLCQLLRTYYYIMYDQFMEAIQ